MYVFMEKKGKLSLNYQCHPLLFRAREMQLLPYTVELQWLEHLWDHEN